MVHWIGILQVYQYEYCVMWSKGEGLFYLNIPVSIFTLLTQMHKIWQLHLFSHYIRLYNCTTFPWGQVIESLLWILLRKMYCNKNTLWLQGMAEWWRKTGNYSVSTQQWLPGHLVVHHLSDLLPIWVNPLRAFIFLREHKHIFTLCHSSTIIRHR